MDEILNITETFRPITLSEMDGVKLMNRIDTKFALSLEKLIEILPQLKEHYHILEVADTRVPMYESLYFDDADFSFYKDHHNGKTNRFKVRMRKYVESDLFFFEIKHKHKGRTDKKRIATDGFSQSLSPEHLAFLKKYMSEEKDLKANMWNAFNRITLVNNEAKERLTLDFNLKFYWEDDHYEFDNLVIAELKQETVNRNSAYYELMKRNRIRPYRLSKYCIGSIELYSGSLKYNRFKQKLLKLKSINDHVA
jgi:hypothetical protein